MKKTTKGIAAGAVAVCILAGMAGSPKQAESLELSIPFSRDEYDINTDIPVTISVSPEGSAIDGLEYFTDSNTVTFTDSVINTGQIEGDYSFYVRSDDVESNVLSIHVVDITAQNEAARKAEEERLAKEAEDAKAAEEQAAREAEEKVVAEQAAKESEEKKAAEEQAVREAEEQKLLAAQSEKANLPSANVSDVAAQPEPVQQEETAVVVETPAPEENTSTPVGEMVWLSATGEKYHRINNCGRMNPAKARQVSLEDALNRGYGKCSKCW